MIYIASPYSSPIPALVEGRVYLVTKFVDKLIAEGLVVFSPIVYLHPIALRLAKDTTASQWMVFNMTMLRRADEAYFLRLPGWENSHGMTIERNVCRMLSIPTTNFDEDFLSFAER